MDKIEGGGVGEGMRPGGVDDGVEARAIVDRVDDGVEVREEDRVEEGVGAIRFGLEIAEERSGGVGVLVGSDLVPYVLEVFQQIYWLLPFIVLYPSAKHCFRTTHCTPVIRGTQVI